MQTAKNRRELVQVVFSSFPSHRCATLTSYTSHSPKPSAESPLIAHVPPGKQILLQKTDRRSGDSYVKQVAQKPGSCDY
jgi:hypothetical protein